MRYKLFGRSGLRVSELCLGTMTFGREWGWGSDAAESRVVFDAFANAGGNFVDTAHIYTEGSSESLLGEFIASDRDHFVVSTKYVLSTANDISKSGSSIKNMRRCAEESLRRMKTDHIDVYWLHWWDNTTPIEEIMRGMDHLVSSGKVNYIAVSDTPAWQVSRANMLAELRGWAPFAGIQVAYSLIERTAERDLLPMAVGLGMGVTAWSPLAGGILTGKYNDSETDGRGKPISARDRRIATLVSDVARRVGRTPNQVALAAIRQQRRFGDIIPIIGARTAEQITDNLGCLDLTLESDVLDELYEATSISLGFPHDFLVDPSIRERAFGGQYQLLDGGPCDRFR